MKIEEKVTLLDAILDRYAYFYYINIEIFLMFGKTEEAEKRLKDESGISIKVNNNNLMIDIEI